MSVSARQRLGSALRLIGAPLLLGGVIWWAGPQAIWAALRGADGRWLVAGLLCAFAGNVAAAWRWAELARWLGHAVSARWSVAVYFQAAAINALLPGAVIGGDLFRAWQLQRSGCPRGAAGLSVVLDRLSGLWILFALAALGLFGGLDAPEMQRLRVLLHVPDAWGMEALALGVLLAVLVLPLGVLLALATLAGRGARPGSRRAMAVELLQRPGGLNQYLWQAAASLLVQLFTVCAVICAARAFGISLPVWLIAVTTAPILLLASMPVSFGGWGTREAAAVAAWSLFGVAPPLAVAAAAAYGAYALVQAPLALWLRPASGPVSQPDDRPR
ncbi:MAG: flippase-like domain-containing protein [Burkholderiaceae bacterium]|nr:flippase-like domain-containing protein [Burkholderiaceae bacterium]